MGSGTASGGFDPGQLIASAFMPQTRSPSATGIGQATTPGYSSPMSLFAPLMQPPAPPPPLTNVPGAPPPVGAAGGVAAPATQGTSGGFSRIGGGNDRYYNDN